MMNIDNPFLGVSFLIILYVMYSIQIQDRARVTGRIVPPELLEKTMQVVPQSVAQLEQLVDFCVEIYNHGDGSQQTLGTEGLTWESFREKWTQQCADEETIGENEHVER